MGKKTVKPTKTKVMTLADRIPNNRGELLTIYVRMTARVISNPPLPAETNFVLQLERLTEELKEWKKANKNQVVRNL